MFVLIWDSIWNSKVLRASQRYHWALNGSLCQTAFDALNKISRILESLENRISSLQFPIYFMLPDTNPNTNSWANICPCKVAGGWAAVRDKTRPNWSLWSLKWSHKGIPPWRGAFMLDTEFLDMSCKTVLHSLRFKGRLDYLHLWFISSYQSRFVLHHSLLQWCAEMKNTAPVTDTHTHAHTPTHKHWIWS